jgi:hypothetical protein
MLPNRKRSGVYSPFEVEGRFHQGAGKPMNSKISTRFFLLRMPCFLATAILGHASAIHAEEPSPTPVKQERKVSAATRKELLMMEDRLRDAIEKRDPDSLNPILAEYYTDAMEESERALTKRAVLMQCEAGKLESLTIKKPDISQNGDKTTVEGRSKMTVKDRATAKTEEHAVRVRRFWVQKDGKWLLAAQLREFLNEKEKEEHEKESKSEKDGKPESKD